MSTRRAYQRTPIRGKQMHAASAAAFPSGDPPSPRITINREDDSDNDEHEFLEPLSARSRRGGMRTSQLHPSPELMAKLQVLPVDKRASTAATVDAVAQFLLLSNVRHLISREEFSMAFRHFAMGRMLSMLPRMDYLNEVAGLDPVDYYWMLKQEELAVPISVSKRAEIDLKQQIAELRMQHEVALRESGTAAATHLEDIELSLAHKQRELLEVRADIKRYPDECEALLQYSGMMLRVNSANPARFEFVLDTLNSLRRCDTASAEWVCSRDGHGRFVPSTTIPHSYLNSQTYDVENRTHLDPWTLFYSAEHYFRRNAISDVDQIRLMGQLTQALFTMRHSTGPLPMDITLLLSTYVQKMQAEGISSTPESFWLQYVFNTQTVYRRYAHTAFFVETADDHLAALRRMLLAPVSNARWSMHVYDAWWASVTARDSSGASSDKTVVHSDVQIGDYLSLFAQLKATLPEQEFNEQLVRLSKHAISVGVVATQKEFTDVVQLHLAYPSVASLRLH